MDKKTAEKIQKMAEKSGVNYLYLFGSQARGKTTPWSDFDFAVKFGNKTKDTFKARLKLISDLSGALERDDVDVVDIEKADPLLGFNIIKDGKVIFSRNEKERVMDKARAMSFYFDRKFYLDRHFRKALEQMVKQNS
jgi:uncharacterized protein